MFEKEDIPALVISIVLGLIICFFVYIVFQLIYERYFATYKKQIAAFVTENNLQLIHTRQPSKEEFKRIPFKTKRFEDELWSIWKLLYIDKRATGYPLFEFEQYNYEIILCKNKELYYEYWMQVHTRYFFKPVVKILLAKKYKKERVESTKICSVCNTEINQLAPFCPNCNSLFEEED